MVSRRAFVAGLGLGAVGLWGVQNVDSEDIPDINNDTLANSPDEKEVLKTAEFEKLIQELTFYSNGEVDILLKEDHGCYRSIEFGHSKSDEQYTDWTAPEFAGPKTVDMRSVIQSNGPYPDREFELELTGGDDLCFAVGLTTAAFDVPETYLPD